VDEMKTVFDKMQSYFERCELSLKGSHKDIEIASIPGMCIEIGITKGQFDEFESGTDEQQRFHDETLTRYEKLCDTYQAKGFMTAQQRQNLDKTIFARGGGESKTAIVVTFPFFNAPPEWEDFLEIKKYCEEQKQTIKQLVAVLKSGA
jgi:hypothetical protein